MPLSAFFKQGKFETPEMFGRLAQWQVTVM